ncbi:MAG: transcription termination/antitermination protein NusA, partial [Ilumatobacteraceae bacterium]
ARLAARLTGVRVDIRGETQLPHGEDDADYAEGEWVENADGVMEFRAADGSVVSAAEWNEQATAEAATDEPVAAEVVTTEIEEGGDEPTS